MFLKIFLPGVVAPASDVPAPGSQKQVDLCEFEGRLVYIMNVEPARAA